MKGCPVLGWLMETSYLILSELPCSELMKENYFVQKMKKKNFFVNIEKREINCGNLMENTHSNQIAMQVNLQIIWNKSLHIVAP